MGFWNRPEDGAHRITKNELTGNYRIEMYLRDSYSNEEGWHPISHSPRQTAEGWKWFRWEETEFSTLAGAQAQLKAHQLRVADYELSKVWTEVWREDR